MKPMLSATCDDAAKLTFPVLASPKLDGIRCIMVSGRAYSRNMKLIPNRYVQRMLSGLPRLDGELIVGEPTSADCYRNTNSGVMSVEGEPEFTFYIFDIWGYEEGLWFEARLRFANKMIVRAGGKNHPFCKLLFHERITSVEELNAYEALCLDEGYEGVMVRSPSGPYKQGRATLREGYLSKIKRFTDGEYFVRGIVEQMHNGNELQQDELGRAKRTSHKAGKTGKGTMGALIAEDTVTGVEFQIGTGFTDAERQDIWDGWPGINDTIRKYKSLNIGVKDKPRHPVDLGPRNDL